MNRKFLLALSLSTALVAAAGCSRQNPVPMPSATPKVSTKPMATTMILPTTIPQASPSPSATTEQAIQTPAPEVKDTESTKAPAKSSQAETKKEAAEKIAAEVDKMSEVEKAHVIVMGDTALVGVEFAKQYAGSLTTRIKDMVIEKAKETDDAIKNVAVTVDPDLLTRIRAMADGNANTSIASEFTEIFNRILPRT